MTPADFLKRIVDPTLALLSALPDVTLPVTDEARALVMTIAGQESNWMYRKQGGGGPARSYWQFEGSGGGTGEVIAKTPKQLAAVCAYLEIPFNFPTVFEAMAWNDTLACTMARLLLWQDPAKLPVLGDVKACWNYYERNWRPGAPHPDVWPVRYTASLVALGL